MQFVRNPVKEIMLCRIVYKNDANENKAVDDGAFDDHARIKSVRKEQAHHKSEKQCHHGHDGQNITDRLYALGVKKLKYCNDDDNGKVNANSPKQPRYFISVGLTFF